MASSPDRHPTQSADKDRTDQVVETAKQAASDARKAVEAGSENAVRASSNIIRHTALENRDLANTGVRLVAEAASHAVETSLAQARHVSELPAHVTEAATVSEPASRGVAPVPSTYSQLGQGLLAMQQTYFGMVQEAMSRAARRQQELMSCRSLPELAQVQREIYVEGMGFFMQSSKRMLEMAGDAVKHSTRQAASRSE